MKDNHSQFGTVMIGKPLPLAPQRHTPAELDTQFVIANVRALLAERNVPANWLARHMNGKYSNLNPWISRLMTGKMKPDLKMLFSIANALNVPIERIVGDDYLKQL